MREPRSQPDGDDQASHVCPLLKVTEPVNREKELTEPKVLILSGLRFYHPPQNKGGWGGVQLRPGSGEESLSCAPCGCSLGCPQGAGRPSGKTLPLFLTGETLPVFSCLRKDELCISRESYRDGDRGRPGLGRQAPGPHPPWISCVVLGVPPQPPSLCSLTCTCILDPVGQPEH